MNENALKYVGFFKVKKKKKSKIIIMFFSIVAFFVCEEYRIIYANGRLACLMPSCQQNTLQGLLCVVVERFETSYKFSNDGKHQRLATSWTSVCYNAWSRPLYHEQAFAQ